MNTPAVAHKELKSVVQENDRTTLFEQYRDATNELSRARMTLTDVESQVANLRQELQIKSADNKRFTERIEYLERELQQVKHHSLSLSLHLLLFQHTSVGQEYEIQLSNMNRSLQRNEEIIKKLQLDKQSYANEIGNIRDLNSTVETKKEQIVRQLTSREIENEQLQATISDMKIEIEMLRTQVNNEKAMVYSLEEIIGSSREKEFQSQMQAQERDSDLHLAKDRANMSDLKLCVVTKGVERRRGNECSALLF